MKAKKQKPISPTSPEPKELGSVIDEEEWDLIFLPALKDDPETADDIARLLVRLDRVLDRPKGRELLHATFRAGVRKAFAYSGDYRERFDLYTRYVAGDLKPLEEPKDKDI